MSKESTKAAFQKAFSDHTLLNLSEEEERSLREWYGFRRTHPFGAAVEVKDRAFYSDPTRGSMTCILCRSTTVVEIHCKIVCKNCGFTRDCSDP